ncbi:hypothetical protein L228DRAFT_177435 [Xylona heveae TC161]|uniref:Hook C-terminal domain-containing protein n=1 Tax=Xylona heveae (strain CBS 132557 / TC161) TaxID=1328760 RepID=A0A165F8C9_XYLHT|nr:hypothetical protein L228DRAFT_177435 [Xylona heveae TC161]KZF20694.1 hypothetical protein L228DRAFT_177435 [Xylona heveae TC161]
MAERFRQKLEASKEIEKEVNVLRENLDEANEHLKELDAIKKQCAGLQLANAEYRKNLPMLEQDIHELQKIKRSLEFEKSTLAQKFDRVNEQLVKDQDLLAEQQDRIRELEADHVPFVQANGNLDSELASSEEDSSALKLENNNLKAEIKKLSEQSTSPEKFLLEQLLEDAKTKTEIFERKYLEVHSEKLVLEASLNELRQEDPTGSARTFLSLREKLQNAKEEAAKTSKELNDAKTELSNVKRQLLTAQTDLSLVDKDRLEVLEGVKKANSSQTEELSNEIEQFQRRYKDLESDLDVQKTLLNAALLGKGALQEELSNRLTKESDRASAEIKAGIELLKAAAEGQEGSQGALEDHIGKMMSKLIEYRERISKRSEHIKKQNEIIMSLEKQVENAQKSAAESSSTDSSAQEAALREEMRNIQRENSLIATAWYDLTSRLQTNSVVVQRRNDAPKSWLNKQRQLLTASSASVHRR